MDELPLDVMIALVGNKIDLEQDRQVSVDEIKEYVAEKDLIYIETSARLGINIHHVFNEIGNHSSPPPPSNSLFHSQKCTFEDYKNTNNQHQRQSSASFLCLLTSFHQPHPTYALLVHYSPPPPFLSSSFFNLYII